MESSIRWKQGDLFLKVYARPIKIPIFQLLEPVFSRFNRMNLRLFLPPYFNYKTLNYFAGTCNHVYRWCFPWQSRPGWIWNHFNVEGKGKRVIRRIQTYYQQPNGTDGGHFRSRGAQKRRSLDKDLF